MTRLIDADRLTDVVDEIDWYHLHDGRMVHGANSDTDQPWYKSDDIYKAIKDAPTAEPTLYGYKVEHLALIARVMQKDGVTPEEAVQVFKDVQTIALKVIDEIDGAVKRAFEQAIETGNGESNEQKKH